MLEVTDQAHLESLPDGTIIRWRRILGDPTSEAVAFIRKEPDTALDDEGRLTVSTHTVWISPGGWTPMTVEEAGITYPCEVVLIAAGHTEDCHRTAEHPPVDPDGITWNIGGHDVRWPSDGIEVGTYMRGGTWSREKALECASRAWAGAVRFYPEPHGTDYVLNTAEHFETWLNRDTLADALNDGAAQPPERPVSAPGRDAVTQREIDIACDLIRAHDTIGNARLEFGGDFCTNAALRRMIETAASVLHKHDALDEARHQLGVVEGLEG